MSPTLRCGALTADGNPRVGHVIEEDISIRKPRSTTGCMPGTRPATAHSPMSRQPSTSMWAKATRRPPLGTFILSGSSNSPTKVNLSWTSAPDPRGAEITGYRVAQMVYPDRLLRTGDFRQECPAAGDIRS